MNANKNLLLITLIVAAMLSRLIPHAPNFTAVIAVGLFAGFSLKGNLKAFLVPLIALWLSDLLINNIIYASYSEGFIFATKGFGWIYAGMIMAVIIGRLGISRLKITPLVASGISASLVFYLITNFGSWFGQPLYAQSFPGLISSYVAGLPFLLNQVLGTAFYGAILFGAAYLWRSKLVPQKIDA